MISTFQYVLSVVFAYLGLAAGLIISYMAREELKPGRKHFVLAQQILLVVIFEVFFFLFGWTWVSMLVYGLFVVIILQFVTLSKANPYMYSVFGFFAFFAKDIAGFALICSLIFIYGLLSAALELDVKKKNYARILLRSFGFVVVAVLLWIVW
ncbi:MAG: hypothetical protein ABIF10_04255 [Candidatus Woesearchaeota archaeon]